MPLLSSQQLARTYSHPSKDPWEAVELYRQSQRYPDDWGAQRVATKMGVNRGEIRTWVDGNGMPDAARAIDIARNHGWLEDDWTPVTTALSQLVSGIFGFGSINQNFVPAWSPSDDVAESIIETALNTVGIGYTHVRRPEPSQGDEIRPQTDASCLGRALIVAGAPKGDKTAKNVTALPEYLDSAPASVRAEFLELLIRDRAPKHPGKATRQIQTDRTPGYFRDIAELVKDVTGESATSSDQGVTISADAIRALGLAE